MTPDTTIRCKQGCPLPKEEGFAICKHGHYIGRVKAKIKPIN